MRNRKRQWDWLRRWQDLVHGAITIARVLPTIGHGLASALLIATILLAAFPIALAVISGSLIVQIIGDPGADIGPLPSNIFALLIGTGGLIILQNATRHMTNVLGDIARQRVDDSLRVTVLEASLTPVDIGHLEDPRIQETFNTARNLSPFSFTPGDAAHNLPLAVVPRLHGLFAAIIFAIHIPLAAVVLFLLFVVGQVVAIGVVMRMIAASAFAMHDRSIGYYRDLALTLPAAKEIRIFGMGSWLRKRYLDIANDRAKAALASQAGLFGGFLTTGGILGLGLATGLFWIGIESTYGNLGLYETIVLIFVLIRWFSIFSMIPDIPVMYGTLVIPTIKTIKSKGRTRIAVSSEPTPTPQLETGLEFRDVSFRYPGSNQLILNGLNLHITAGQQLALVGLNGAGKTTIIKLLCRLYDPNEGAIYVDGIDVREIDPVMWRQRMAILFQDYIQWQLPILDNISLRASSQQTDFDIQFYRDAVNLAGGDHLVDSMPSKWETILSAEYSDGFDLSGGEWQLLALARAMYRIREGARLIVLDEPTANLDPKAEQEFNNSILTNRYFIDPLAKQEATKSAVPTCIVISHRFTTVLRAERIMVLDEGHIIEDGSHEQLLRNAGRYAELFEAQASLFRENNNDV